MKKPIQQVQSKHFYSHLIEIDSLFIELEGVELSEEELSHLIDVLTANVHHSIMDAVLSELSPDDKKVFLHHLSLENHSKVWEHLRTKVINIEEKIKDAAEDLKETFKKDIEEVKKKEFDNKT